MKRFRFWTLLAVIVLVVPVVLGACGGDDSGDDAQRVKIMLAFPDGLDTYRHMVQGAELALSQAGGKAGDVSVEFVVQPTSSEDTVYWLDGEKASAEAAVKDKAVVAYLGLMSSNQAKVGIPILNEASIVGFSVSATWPGLTKAGFGPGEPGIHYPSGKRSFFRMVSSDDVQAEVAARWVAEQGYKTVFLIDNGTTYGQGLTGIFEVQAGDNEVQVLGRASYDAETATAANYDAIAEDVVAAAPDLVYCGVHAYGGGAELVGALRRADPDLVIMSGDAMVPFTNLFEVNPPELVEGIIATDVDLSPPDMGYEATDAFIAAYQEAYDEPPLGVAMATFDIVNLLLDVIAKSDKPTRENVLDGVQNMALFSGAMGEWQFDESGDISNTQFGLWQITGGAWTFAEVIRGG